MPEKNNCQQRFGFETNEYVVYPTHGVGRIVAIEEQEIAGCKLELFVINFEKDKMTLRVPTSKTQSAGMRKLSDDSIVARALDTLRGRARVIAGAGSNSTSHAIEFAQCAELAGDWIPGLGDQEVPAKLVSGRGGLGIEFVENDRRDQKDRSG